MADAAFGVDGGGGGGARGWDGGDGRCSGGVFGGDAESSLRGGATGLLVGPSVWELFTVNEKQGLL